jgi:hypothetical protein
MRKNNHQLIINKDFIGCGIYLLKIGSYAFKITCSE